MFRVVPPPIIRKAKNCIYNILYLSHRYCYLPLLWKSWNSSTIATSGICHTVTAICRYRGRAGTLPRQRHLVFVTPLLPSATIVEELVLFHDSGIWYLSHRYCYLPLSWKSWNSSTIAASGICYTVTAICRYRGRVGTLPRQRHLVFVTPLLPSATIVEELELFHDSGIWYFSHRYCHLPLSWKSWNSSTVAADSSNVVTNTRCSRYSCMRS